MRRPPGRRSSRKGRGAAPKIRIPDHPLVCPDPPEIIEEADALASFLDHVRTAGVFAYDTEFIGEESYHRKLCLIQMATSARVAVIDPMNGLDVTGVWELIADPALETIVHAGDQDLEPVVRHLDRTPANIFDTQVAAAFTNRPYPLSLLRMVEDILGVELPRSMAYTRWDHRPLSPLHTQYAAEDVRTLIAVRAQLGEELEQRGHDAWVRAECERLSAKDLLVFNGETQRVRAQGNRDLRPRGTAILGGLVYLRDEIARAVDLPPRTVLRDDVLVRLAKNPVRTTEALAATKGFPRPIASDYGEKILRVIKEAVELPAKDLPVSTAVEETPDDQTAIDGLWAIVSCYCRGLGIAPGIVTSRRVIAQFYLAERSGIPREELPVMQSWRRELAGAFMESLLAGRTSVGFAWRDGTLVAERHPEA